MLLNLSVTAAEHMLEVYDAFYYYSSIAYGVIHKHACEEVKFYGLSKVYFLYGI